MIDPSSSAYILELAARGGAEAVRLSEFVGTIEAGKRADLIIVDLESALHNVTVNDVYSQLAHTMKATDIRSTMADDRFLMRDRTLLTVDEEYLREEGQQARTELCERIESFGDR